MDSAQWDERYAASDLVWSVEPNQWVVDVAGPLSPGRVLDLAAGEGRKEVVTASRTVPPCLDRADRARSRCAGAPPPVESCRSLNESLYNAP